MKKDFTFLFIVVMAIAFSFNAIPLDSKAGEKDIKEAKVDRLIELSYKTMAESPEAAMTHGNEALKLAKELKYVSGEASALKALGKGCREMKNNEKALELFQQALHLFIKIDALKDTAAVQDEIGDVYRKLGNYEQALKHHQDSLLIEEKTGEQVRIAALLNKIGNDNLRLNRCEDALANFQEALKINQAAGEKPGIAEVLNNIGIVYYELSQYDRALKYFRESLQIKKILGNKESIALGFNNIGLIYDLTGDYGKAIENYLQALQLQEEIGDKGGISGSLNNIGVIYMNLKNNEKALEYYKKAIIIEEELGNPINLSIIYNNIGIIHRRASRFDQALKNYQKALELVEGTGHKSGISRTLNNIGITYDELNQPQNAVKYFKKSLQINEEIDNKKGAAADLFNLGASYLSAKNYAAASTYLARALKIARDLEVKDLARDCYESLSKLYGEQGNHKKALEYFKLYVEQKDGILNQETNTKIAELQTRYETEKKEKKITLLEKDNELLKKNSEIQKLKLSKERLKANAFIVGFILVMIIALLILKKYLHFFAFWKKRNYIGHYKIIDQIGAGGMGVIYKAIHVMKNSEPVAVKVIREEFARDETQRKRFLNEALLVDQLNYPHIVKVYERGEYNQRLYIAMEILEGPSLAEIIRRGEMLPLPDCLSIMGQLAATVAKVHARGIVHRDLKPDNIILINHEGNRNFVKLLDFGLARHPSLTHLTGTGEILGTINYLPPEQISRQEYSPASDIYSLGVVFYELLTLEQPFIGDFPVDIIKQILDKDPLEPLRFRPELSPEINRLIVQMMNKSPGQRPTEEIVLKTLEVSYEGGRG